MSGIGLPGFFFLSGMFIIVRQSDRGSQMPTVTAARDQSHLPEPRTSIRRQVPFGPTRPVGNCEMVGVWETRQPLMKRS